MADIVVSMSDGMNVVLTPNADGSVTLSLAGRVWGERNPNPYERVVVTLTDADGDELRRGLVKAQTEAQHALSLQPQPWNPDW